MRKGGSGGNRGGGGRGWSEYGVEIGTGAVGWVDEGIKVQGVD